VLDARWLHRHGVDKAVEAIKARVGGNACYVTFDIDFIDPAFAPGTGTPVIGGFDTHTALELIRGMAGVRVIGADVVEVSPPFDHAEITALAGAGIAQEILCLMALGKAR
jgi:agmatinase